MLKRLENFQEDSKSNQKGVLQQETTRNLEQEERSMRSHGLGQEA